MPVDLPDYSSVIYRPDDVLTGSPWSYSSGTNTKTFPIPVGSHIVAVLLPGYTTVSNLLVTGSTSTVQYINAYPNDSIVPRPFYGIVSSAVDTSITVKITASSSGTAYLTTIHDPVAVAIAQADAQPWQSANLPPVPISFGYPGNGGTSVVITAPAAPQSVWLHSFSYRWNVVTANSFGIWQTTGGLEICADPGANDLTQRPYEGHGTKLPVATGLEFVGQGAAAVNSCFAQGMITYSVY